MQSQIRKVKTNVLEHWRKYTHRLSFAHIGMLLCLLVLPCCFANCVKHVAGPKGDKGAPGGNGNARIVKSINTTVGAETWVSPVAGTWERTLLVAEIDDAILKNGHVDVYAETGKVWAPLPFMVVDVIYEARLETGRVQLVARGLHGEAARPATMVYRVLVYSSAP